MVRLGSRTKTSDRIKEFNIEEVCRKKNIHYRNGDIRMLHEMLEDIEYEIEEIRNALSSFRKRMNWKVEIKELRWISLAKWLWFDFVITVNQWPIYY